MWKFNCQPHNDATMVRAKLKQVKAEVITSIVKWRLWIIQRVNFMGWRMHKMERQKLAFLGDWNRILEWIRARVRYHFLLASYWFVVTSCLNLNESQYMIIQFRWRKMNVTISVEVAVRLINRTAHAAVMPTVRKRCRDQAKRSDDNFQCQLRIHFEKIVQNSVVLPYRTLCLTVCYGGRATFSAGDIGIAASRRHIWLWRICEGMHLDY